MTAATVQAEGRSDIGPVREENQDVVRMHTPTDPQLAETHGSLLAIADGMGGYAQGGVASATAIETFFTAFYESQPADPRRALRRATEQANLAVHQAGFRLNAGQMGTTLTVANIAGDQLYLAHVGDTRAYLVRGGQARCLTTDHSLVGELVRMRVITPAQVRTHHQRSMLNRSLGLNLFVQPEVSVTRLEPDDVLILCSDGLWACVEDDEFAGLATGRPETGELCRQLVELALQRQTDDNASVLVARVEQVGAASPMAASVRRGWRRLAHALQSLF